MHHLTLYRDPQRFAGWPANYGIWSWGQEIVVGFTVGWYKDRDEGVHAVDRTRPFTGMLARSLDGGESWQVDPATYPLPDGRAVSVDEHVDDTLKIGQPQDLIDCPGGINFLHPDFALMGARTGLKAGAISWFYTSFDRCRTWDGPYKLPLFDTPGIAARTDYLVSDQDTCTLFLTAVKSNGNEGRLLCARTVDGGQSFQFRSWIGEEPAGYAIMPASLRLPEGQTLVARRCAEDGRYWIDLYASDDDCQTWRYLSTPAPELGRWGNPPVLLRLQDGRLCLIYGYRDAPAGIRARLSTDEGLSWGEAIILRADGGSHDLGYPRAMQRPDGTVVIVYYYNDQPKGERYIAVTLWKP
ncbi:MAG: glycoside hydrolase [Anaerolineae bacterium]|nr:glycoside hydrolase [Anaerolineae bacterium]